MSSNKGGKFFKFQNVQIVRRPNATRQTRQNTQINSQGSAEQQFQDIEATARQEALVDLNDLLSEDESVDYSTPRQPLQPTVQVQNQIQQTQESDDTSASNPETVTDSSLDSSSIEVLHPDTGLQIPLPTKPPQRQPPTHPPTPRTNVAVPHNDNLITDDEETGDQVVPPAVGAQTTEQGRRETLSPTPQNTQTIQSEIELTVNDLETSNQRLTDKCAEIDLQLSTHVDWSKPNYRLRTDLCEVISILYRVGYNTDGFPSLEKYLYETVGTLPYQSLLRIALDSVFEEFPEISAIQTKVYRMLKCHLSIINHTSVTQFDDITLSNHNFDRVAGADLHNVSGPDLYSVSGPEVRPNLSLQTDLNETYYSVYSQSQRQVYRVTKRALDRIPRDRANSCPELIVQLNKEGDETVDRSSRYYTAKHYIHSTVSYNQKNQETQTKWVSDRDTRIHYTSSSEDSDSDTSECDENIEGTENITVTKRYLKSRSLSSEDLYTAPAQPYKRFRTSTPEPYERKPEKEPFRCPLKEIINHEGALKVPPVDIIIDLPKVEDIQHIPPPFPDCDNWASPHKTNRNQHVYYSALGFGKNNHGPMTELNTNTSDYLAEAIHITVCNQYKRKYEKLLDRITTIKQNITYKIQKVMPRLMPNENAIIYGKETNSQVRQKRAIPLGLIFTGVSAIGGLIMKGVNTWSNYKKSKAMTQAVEKLYEAQEIDHKRLTRLEGQTSLLAKTTKTAFQHIDYRLIHLDAKLNNTVQHMTEFFKRTESHFWFTWEALVSNRLAIHLLSSGSAMYDMVLRQYFQYYQNYDVTLDHFLTGLDALGMGRLTFQVLDPDELDRFLSAIRRTLREERSPFELAFNHTYQFYAEPMVMFTNTHDQLLVNVPILLKLATQKPLNLYSIDTVPMPFDTETLEGRNNEYTFINNSYPYMAINEHNYIPLRNPNYDYVTKWVRPIIVRTHTCYDKEHNIRVNRRSITKWMPKRSRNTARRNSQQM